MTGPKGNLIGKQLRDFGGKQFHCQMSSDFELTNESKRFCAITMPIISTEAHVPTPRFTPRYGQYITHAHNHLCTCQMYHYNFIRS